MWVIVGAEAARLLVGVLVRLPAERLRDGVVRFGDAAARRENRLLGDFVLLVVADADADVDADVDADADAVKLEMTVASSCSSLAALMRFFKSL